MRKIFLLIYGVLIFADSCKKLDVAPPNIITDDIVLGTKEGVTSYMARLYSEMYIEDFKWSPYGYNNGGNTFHSPNCETGEAMGRDYRQPNEQGNAVNWNGAYSVIRDCNYFIQHISDYTSKYTGTQVQNWLGEVYFLRATTYFALVKRFGGVPLITTVINYPATTSDSVAVNGLARASEASTWQLISDDLDSAIAKLPLTNEVSRADMYTAAAYKARAMLYAGCIAKYNTNLSPSNPYNTGQLCGFPSGTDPAPFFEASYNAAKMVINSNKYSLYMKGWVTGNLPAQIQNMIDMFFDASSPENIFVRQYDTYLTDGHDYDVYNIADPLRGPAGWGSETSPTLELVEMYDGFPHWQSGPYKGKLQNLDSKGNYVLYNKPTDLFANAEPRLKAYVLTPFDVLKGTTMEMRRGIYMASTGGTGLLKPSQIPGAGEGNTAAYPNSGMIIAGNGPTSNVNPTVTLPNGEKLLASGNMGPFNPGAFYNNCAWCGFGLRKYINSNLSQAQVQGGYSTQTWIDMRYAEVLLTAAEDIMELKSLGQSANVAEALSYVNSIQERAGATITTVSSFDLQTVRKEWRKEFAFENKTWFNLLRWRIIDKENTNKVYRQLTSFLVADVDKYIFDVRPFERAFVYNFNPIWYYQAIPGSELANNKKMIQNVGY